MINIFIWHFKYPTIKKLILVILLCNISFSFSQNLSWEKLNPITNNLPLEQKVDVLIDNTWYHIIRDYNNSFPLIEEAFELAKKTNYTLGVGRAYLAYANYYLAKGDFQLANEFAVKSKKILTLENDLFYLKELFITQTNINIYYKNSKNKINKLLELLKIETTPFQKARLYVLLARIYTASSSSNFSKSLDYINLAKNEFNKLNSPTGKALINLKLSSYYKNLIIFYKKKKYFKNSVDNASQAISFYKKYNQKSNLAKAYKIKALAHSVLGKHEESIPFYKESLSIQNELGNLYQTMKINQHLFIAYSILKNHKKAIKANTEYVKLKDSIFSLEKHRLIIDANIKFETEKITLEKKIIEHKNKKNKNLLLSTIIISVLLLLSILFSIGRYKTKKNNELILIELEETHKRLALEKQYRSSELKALKAQMDPHFIFNALNSIQEYILLNQKDLASDYLGKFADLMRKYLNYSDKGEISVQEEIETLKMYLELEKVRFEDTLNYTFTIEDNLDTSDFHIPTMLIQPYIENALKHGLLHRKDNRELSISFSKKEQNIQCIIIDNGVGREKSKKIQSKKNKLHKSFATKATQERLELLNFGKDAKIGVEIIDLNKNEIATGTQVVLIIPQIN